MRIQRTNSQDIDFIHLVKALDAYLKITDKEEHDFYNQFNGIDVLNEVVVVYKDATKKMHAVGCAAMKKFDETTVEVKRMYVLLEERGIGIAQ